ncbi:luciferin 4-monooxygenase [Culex quinquefasciatus]|uniref:Luciferin 4-monooxygenase n=1 Tax=Culex quinquefasciatus TaxID=7176 RepID=B0WU03_CULQU|nr:luciferin 4-monooxygenase [Culex quinquefasciatus]|eukprot:XP_001857251.1 luciferin 4-monooxygenase [Culex quinquefasciatus]
MATGTRDDERFILYGGPDPRELLQDRSLGEMIVKELRKQPDNVGLVDPVSEVQLTYRQILEQSAKLAAGMTTMLGLTKQDHTAIVSDNCLEYCLVMFGSIFAASPLALLNPAYVEGELEHGIKLSLPKVIFVSPNALEKIVAVVRKLGLPAKIVLFGEHPKAASYAEVVSFAKLLSSPVNVETYVPDPVDPNAHVALILLSSGTTGLPKGVQLTHINLMTTVAHSMEASKILELPEQLVALAATPLFHAVAGVGLINMITNNCRCVLMPKFSATLFLESIQKYKVNLMTVVPPLMVFLAKHPIVDNYDLSSLMTLICGAAPLSKEIEDKVRDRLGIAFIRQGYGLSETTLGVLMQTGFENKAGCVGKVRMGQWVKVIEPETGKILGPNQRGELCFKGSLIMKGYVGMESAIDADGWLHTGDVGYYDEDEDFFIVDRIKELIKYKGFQVPPAELEAILLKNPKVKDAAVIGIPDERVGELATAYVVKEDDEQVSAEEIVKFVASQVSPQKQLHGGVRFIDEIPKTASGKILRRELRELAKNTKSKL